jgi:hypothetical protein
MVLFVNKVFIFAVTFFIKVKISDPNSVDWSNNYVPEKIEKLLSNLLKCQAITYWNRKG